MHGEASPLGGGPLTRESSSAEDVTHDDHPLALSSGSKWNTFFKDNEIKEQIDRDVMRTHPDMHFFSGDTPAAEQHRAVSSRAAAACTQACPTLLDVYHRAESTWCLALLAWCQVALTAASAPSSCVLLTQPSRHHASQHHPHKQAHC
jgi:hypothetical protein